VVVPEHLQKIKFLYMFDGTDDETSPSNVFKKKFPSLAKFVHSMDLVRGGALDDILDDDVLTRLTWQRQQLEL
jgi:hypothetical protein